MLHQVRRLTPAWIGALVCVLALLAFVLLARQADDAPSTSDAAVIESYVRLATEGRLTVGAYSRFQWHHPGPLYFYWLAPFYAASANRGAGLHAGSAALSLLSLLLAAAVLVRRQTMVSLAVLLAIGLLCARSSAAIVSPWNPHVPLLPVAALLVATADTLAGNAWMLPAVAVLASLAGQAHIALLPCVLLVGVAAGARGIVGAVGGRAGAWRAALGVTAAVLALAWAVPLYEQLTATPRGNFTELWRFFVEQPRRGQPWSAAVSAWSDMIVGPLRGDFHVAQGWPFAESRVRWAEALSAALAAATAALGIRARSVERRFDGALGAVALVASGTALWSITRIEERIFDHDVFWMAGVGAVLVGTAFGLVLSAGVGRWRLPGWVFTAALALVLGTGLASSFAGLQAVVARSSAPAIEARIARAVADDLQAHIDREGIRRPLIRIDQDAWGFAAGAILDLQKRGYDVAVEEDWVVMFTPECRPRSDDDAVWVVAAPAEHLRLLDRGMPVISSHEPVFVHAVAPER